MSLALYAKIIPFGDFGGSQYIFLSFGFPSVTFNNKTVLLSTTSYSTKKL